MWLLGYLATGSSLTYLHALDQLVPLSDAVCASRQSYRMPISFRHYGLG